MYTVTNISNTENVNTDLGIISIHQTDDHKNDYIRIKYSKFRIRYVPYRTGMRINEVCLNCHFNIIYNDIISESGDFCRIDEVNSDLSNIVCGSIPLLINSKVSESSKESVSKLLCQLVPYKGSKMPYFTNDLSPSSLFESSVMKTSDIRTTYKLPEDKTKIQFEFI